MAPSTKLHLPLALSYQENHRDFAGEIPAYLYRYFSSLEASTNFLHGDIWLAGPNQLRFYLNPDNPEKNDPSEFFYENGISGSVLGAYSLSCSTVPVKHAKDKYWLKIAAPGFVHALKKSLAISSNMPIHEISWLEKDPLLEIAKLRKQEHQTNSVKVINELPQVAEIVRSQIVGLSSWPMYYTDNSIAAPFGMEVTRRALGKSKDFDFEKEWRILLSLAYLQPYVGNLYHLVEYIKLKCPEISEYCTAMTTEEVEFLLEQESAEEES